MLGELGSVSRLADAAEQHRAAARPIEQYGAAHRLLEIRDIRDRKASQERIRFLAHHDALELKLDRLVQLKPLGREGVRHQLTVLLKGPVAPEVLDLVYGKTNGNPFYVSELVRLLVKRGWIAYDGRVWVPKNPDDKRPPHQIPESDRDYYLERMYPAFGNLVPRDIAARAAKLECDAGKGVGNTGYAVYLDFAEAIGRLVSLAFRAGVPVEKVVDQLKGIGGEHPVFQEGGLVLSIPDAISRVLEKGYLTGKNAKKNHKSQYSLMGEKCPECGQTVSFEEGCMICHFCGFNKCG